MFDGIKFCKFFNWCSPNSKVDFAIDFDDWKREIETNEIIWTWEYHTKSELFCLSVSWSHNFLTLIMKFRVAHADAYFQKFECGNSFQQRFVSFYDFFLWFFVLNLIYFRISLHTRQIYTVFDLCSTRGALFSFHNSNVFKMIFALAMFRYHLSNPRYQLLWWRDN